MGLDLTNRNDVRLELPSNDFDALHKAVDKTRKGSKTVTVDKEALRLLLSDHSRAIAGLGHRARQVG